MLVSSLGSCQVLTVAVVSNSTAILNATPWPTKCGSEVLILSLPYRYESRTASRGYGSDR